MSDCSNFKKTLTIVICLIPAQANAHCFSVWHYNFKQQCEHRKKQKPFFENKDYYVEIIKIPDERDQAIDKLKELMK